MTVFSNHKCALGSQLKILLFRSKTKISSETLLQRMNNAIYQNASSLIIFGVFRNVFLTNNSELQLTKENLWTNLSTQFIQPLKNTYANCSRSLLCIPSLNVPFKKKHLKGAFFIGPFVEDFQIFDQCRLNHYCYE